MTIVTYEMHSCLLGGSGACSPRKIFEFTSSQIASDTIWDKISKHFDDTYSCSVTTILNFKIAGRGKFQPPLLSMKPCSLSTFTHTCTYTHLHSHELPSLPLRSHIHSNVSLFPHTPSPHPHHTHTPTTEGRNLADVRTRLKQNMDNQKFAAQEAEHIQLDMIGRDVVNRVEVCVCVCVYSIYLHMYT